MKKITLFILGLIVCGVLSANELPNVSIKDINGNLVNVSELTNDDKPIIISFWATWCKPCRNELKAIHEVYADWQDETGVKMYIVSIDEAQDIQKVRPMVDGFGWEYEVMLDTTGDLKRAMNITAIPYLLILDGKGKIVYRHEGYAAGGEDEVYEIIKAL